MALHLAPYIRHLFNRLSLFVSLARRPRCMLWFQVSDRCLPATLACDRCHGGGFFFEKRTRDSLKPRQLGQIAFRARVLELCDRGSSGH